MPSTGSQDNQKKNQSRKGDLDLIPFSEFKEGELKLVDLNTIPFHMQMDYKTRNKNIIGGWELCERCDGTGNELFSMYRQCEDCQGSGRA